MFLHKCKKKIDYGIMVIFKVREILISHEEIEA